MSEVRLMNTYNAIIKRVNEDDVLRPSTKANLLIQAEGIAKELEEYYEKKLCSEQIYFTVNENNL
jgi:hypothetical protein